jgi:NADPH-dependent curcumin reductase CurA
MQSGSDNNIGNGKQDAVVNTTNTMTNVVVCGFLASINWVSGQ